MPKTRLLIAALAAALVAGASAYAADAAPVRDGGRSTTGKNAGKPVSRAEPTEDPRRIAAQEEARERAEEAKQAEARRISRERRAREEEGRWLARSKACVVKPVMTDEEIARCREAGR